MAEVWLRSALAGYAHIFPPDAPKPTIERLARQLRAVDCGFVCTSGDAIVGLVQVDDDELSHLYVDPAAWRVGIGGALHDTAVAALRERGYSAAALWVLRDNAIGRTMYERRGWTLTDKVRTVYGPAGIDDVHYTLDL